MHELIRKAFGNLEDGRLGEAEAKCRVLLSGDEGDKEDLALAEALLGFIQHRQGDSLRGQGRLRKVVDDDEPPELSRFLMGLCHLEQGNFREAAEALEQYLSFDPGHLQAWLALSQARKRCGDAAGHLDALERAAQAAPHVAKIQLVFAGALSDVGKVPAALSCLENYLLHHGPDAEVHVALGMLCQSEKENRKAEEHYRAALAVNASDARVLNNLSSLLQERGMFAEALELLERAVEAAPDYLGARFNLGNLHLASGRHEAAEDAFRRVIGQKPDFAPAHNNLGAALLKMGRAEEAIAILETSVTLDSSSVDAHYNLANALSKTGRLEDSLRPFQIAVSLSPGEERIRLGLAEALLKLGRIEDAHERIQATLTERPASTRALSLS
ncbi:MAG: tetratricopeptide repeat protein, partial [Kiloniellales bacterium]|nr:tetratricopeptide repeat protein [Kiloniellales bacterium]